jgi:hypothetical protein
MIGSSTVLTISAGAVIKFDQFDSLNVQGQLLAQGTPSNEIYFTSIHDDSVGGDTNGNGNATTPANGDWYYILLSSNSSQVHLDHVVVRYGGSSAGSIYSWNTNLTLSVSNSIIDNSENSGIFLGGGGTVTVTNSSIENNDDEGIYVSGSSGSLLVIGSSINNNGRDGIEAGNNVVVTDSIISGNVESGIELRPTGAVLSATISDNTITNNSGDAIYVNYNNGAGLPVLSSNTISGNGLDNGIGLGGTVGISATLPGGYPLTYVSRDLNVSLNSTLTISAGAVIKFDLYDSLNVQGQLLARGAPGNEIFFTSLHDDSVGGDTNGNGNATAPAKGDWYYIQLSSNSSRVNLDYAVVRYGGSFGGGIYSGYSDPILSVSNSAISDSDSRGLYLTGGGTVTVTNSTVENNDDEGIYVASSAASLFVTGSSINNNGRDGIGAGSNVIATSNVISGNLESGIELRPTNAVLSATINDNTITNNIEDAIYVNYNGGAGLPVLSNNTLSGNGLDNGIGLGGSLGISMTLPASYYLTFVSRDLTINSNTTLTMEPGTVLKFDAGGSLRVYGILLAQTTPGNEIYFTSIHDDSVGGDTNSNGNATSPVKGDWSRIWLFDDDSRAFFDNVVLRYGGSGSYGVLTIWFNDGKISFNNSLLNDSDSEGIDASNGGTITITNSTIENSDYSGVSTSNATVIISDSVIQNNGYNGVQVYGSGTLSLTNSTISNNGQDGVELGHSAVIATNTISNNGESGIEIRPNTFISPTISDNIITNNTEDALTVNYNLGAGLPILNNNTISGNGLDNGIGLEGTMDISMTLPVSYPLTFVGRNL